MMIRLGLSLVLLTTVAALGGCNDPDGALARPVASAPEPPVALSLPPGAACTNEINRYESVVKADLETGNVEQRVYDQIQQEMARAAAACSSGRTAAAHKIVAASKASHGYRA